MEILHNNLTYQRPINKHRVNLSIYDKYTHRGMFYTWTKSFNVGWGDTNKYFIIHWSECNGYDINSVTECSTIWNSEVKFYWDKCHLFIFVFLYPSSHKECALEEDFGCYKELSRIHTGSDVKISACWCIDQSNIYG